MKSLRYTDRMDETRVQILNGEATIDVIPAAEAAPQKERYTEDQLIRQKSYYEEMIRKGQEGLERVNALLSVIADAKSTAKI